MKSTVALGAAVAVAAGALLLAVLTRRSDLVVVAAPFVTILVASARRRPDVGDVRVRAPSRPLWEDDGALVEITVGGAGADFLQVGIVHSPGLEASGALWLIVPDETLALRLAAIRWGRQSLGPVSVTGFSAHGLSWTAGPEASPVTLAVLPRRDRFAASATVPHSSGHVGAHRSGVKGSGTDLLGVAPFQPGDRLRRITWPVSLRTGRLHVSTTTEDRDAEVMLALDTASDVGTPEPDRVTSLDVAVRACAAIAAHYLAAGDRVGAVDLASPRPLVRLGGSRRHLLRILTGLLVVGQRAYPDASVRRRLRHVPPRALVVVLSPLVDEAIETDVAALLRRAVPLLIIDTLPDGAVPLYPSPDRDLAWRVTLLRREQLRDRLVALGVPVVPWRGAGSLDVALRTLARAAALPRRRPS